MRLAFKDCEHGQCPRNAVAAHHGHQREELFVGRAMHEGSLVPGKINPTHKALYISYGGQEIAKKHYEVLVQVVFIDNSRKESNIIGFSTCDPRTASLTMSTGWRPGEGPCPMLPSRLGMRGTGTPCL